MKNTRRTFGVAGLVVLIAAVAWNYRLAPGEAPAGQPALVTIDAASLEGLRADFNRQRKRDEADRPVVADLRNLSAGGLRSRIAPAGTRESGSSCVCRLATDAPNGLGGTSQLCSPSAVRWTSATGPGIEPSAGNTDEEGRARTAAGAGLLHAVRHFVDLAAANPPGTIWSERMPAATVFNGPVVDVTEAIEDAVAPGRETPRTDSTTAPSSEPRYEGTGVPDPSRQQHDL